MVTTRVAPVDKRLLQAALDFAGNECLIHPAVIRSRSRAPSVVQARRIAVVALYDLGYAATEIGKALGLDRTSVHNAVAAAGRFAPGSIEASRRVVAHRVIFDKAVEMGIVAPAKETQDA